jgi:hypothetical protein
MPPRTCLVEFTGPSGVRHTVAVVGESVYEAAAMAIATLPRGDWVDPLAPGTLLRVQVPSPSIVHTVTLQQIERWCTGVATSPNEVLRRRRVMAIIQQHRCE